MGFANKAIVMDPDIFATADIARLLFLNQKGAAIHAVPGSTGFFK